jgi:UDP-N-acetylglucosamine--N-acetylmuramyl-(pentapeptide) pyrophosphoryl-undecaprenol N-acetylglucosamine transferase
MKKRIMISGGGTGGHIFPALAIAEAFRNLSEVEFLFVGALGRMEMEKVPAAGYPIEGLWISGFQRKNLWRNISLPFKIISSLRKARKLIRSFSPGLVVGTGGYASGPLLKVASGMGIPTLIQEQNSFPGITNKLLAKKVNAICVAYPGMEQFFPKGKIIFTGNPVRADLVKPGISREEARNFFSLSKDQPLILVTGGSLGAYSLNKFMVENSPALQDAGIQAIWQTGRNFKNSFPGYSDPFPRIRRMEFVERMDLAYAAADIVVCRAGALTISEISVTRKPAVLVPSPYVAEDHQTKNANALVKNKAAWMVRENEVSSLLLGKVLELCRAENIQNEMKQALADFARPQAAKEIADIGMKLYNEKWK